MRCWTDLEIRPFSGNRPAVKNQWSLDENFRPRPIAPLLLESDDDRRRHRQAQDRRRLRLEEKKQEKACRSPEGCPIHN